MTDDNPLNLIPKEAITEVAKEAYRDALKPTVRQVGEDVKTVAEAVSIALAPLRLIVFAWDQIEDSLKNRLEKLLRITPREKIAPPDASVVGPLLNHYRYVFADVNLSELFVNLLGNAMNVDYRKDVHPAFVQVLAELSSDEAKLIKTISETQILPVIDIKALTSDKGENSFIYILRNFTLLGEQAQLGYPELAPTYLDNLSRLGILKMTTGGGLGQETYSNEGVYQALEHHSTIKQIEAQLHEGGRSISITRGVIHITAFGKLFMNAVLSYGR